MRWRLRRAFWCWTTASRSSTAAVEVVIAGLLTAAPDVQVLLTSRVPLHIATEQVYPIPALDVGGAALKLFIDRAAVIAPVYALTDANRDPITEICARLEGLPLALELAASRIRVLSPRDLLHEAGQPASTSCARPIRVWPVRHRSLKAVLSTTWRSLGEDQREVLAGLATFQGGFTPDAAEAVTGATPAMLHTLLDHALVQATTDRSGRSRYHLHELVRSVRRRPVQREQILAMTRCTGGTSTTS